MTIVTSKEAQEQLQELLLRAANGEQICIQDSNLPPINLVVNFSPKKRILGKLKGKVVISADFDAPLPKKEEKYFYPDLDQA